MRKLLILLPIIAAVMAAQYLPQAFTHVASGGPVVYSAPGSTQHCYATTSSGTSVGCTLGAAPTAGYLVTVSLFTGGVTGIAVSDGASHSYTKTPNSPSNFYESTSGAMSLFYWTATSGASAMVTGSWTGSCGGCAIQVNVWPTSGGTPSFDVDISAYGVGDVINAPTITASGSGRLLISACAVQDQITTIYSPWTVTPDGFGTYGEAAEYMLSGSSQATGFAQTQPQDWNCIGAAFK